MWLPNINPDQTKALRELHITGSSLLNKIASTIRIWKRRRRIRNIWKASCTEERKELAQVMKDLYALIWRYDRSHEHLIHHYFASSCFRKDRSIHDTVMWSEWYSALVVYSYRHLDLMKRLYNKASSKLLLKEAGLPVPLTLGKLKASGEKLLYRGNDDEESNFSDIIREHKVLFIKPDSASFGDGCMKMEASAIFCKVNGLDCTESELAAKLGNDTFLVEQYVENHPILKAFHPQSLNTVRFITMQTPNSNWELARAALRMGVGNMNIDNLSAGGIAVAIHKDGTLNASSGANLSGVSSYTRHPDTLIKFEGTKIPYYDESVDLCIKAHRTCCPSLFCIGWDIAITTDGPILIEINPHTGLIQSPCGGMRHVYETYLKPLAIKQAHTYPKEP